MMGALQIGGLLALALEIACVSNDQTLEFKGFDVRPPNLTETGSCLTYESQNKS